MSYALSVTPQSVKDFATFMAEKYCFTIIPLDSGVIKMAKRLLKIRGIDLDTFVPFTGLTIPIKGTCYVCLNFEIGDFSRVSLMKQLELIVHESMHAIQAGKKGYQTYYAQYVLSGPKRAVMEAQAYAMGDGFMYLLTGILQSNQDMTKYLLSSKSSKLAEIAYKKSMDMIVEEKRIKQHPLGVACAHLRSLGVM